MKAQSFWTPQVYNRLAPLYGSLERALFPASKIGRRRVVQDLHAGSLLDVGCGTGTVLALAVECNLVCYGLDTSAGMLDWAADRVPGCSLVQGSYYQLPFPDDTFAYVIETNALGGTGIDVRQVLTEMLRVCQKNGEVRLVDYGPASRETWRTRLIKQSLSFFGDEPQDYASILRQLDCTPQVEPIAWDGMYQFVCAMKP